MAWDWVDIYSICKRMLFVLVMFSGAYYYHVAPVLRHSWFGYRSGQVLIYNVNMDDLIYNCVICIAFTLCMVFSGLFELAFRSYEDFIEGGLAEVTVLS